LIRSDVHAFIPPKINIVDKYLTKLYNLVPYRYGVKRKEKNLI